MRELSDCCYTIMSSNVHLRQGGEVLVSLTLEGSSFPSTIPSGFVNSTKVYDRNGYYLIPRDEIECELKEISEKSAEELLVDDRPLVRAIAKAMYGQRA